jgi:3-phenylpropionate/trans-cinnamate dioxygenase ferredoxin reductase subunit
MPVVKADLGLCQGYANCIMAAEVDEADRKRVTEAANSCPVSALRVEDE